MGWKLTITALALLGGAVACDGGPLVGAACLDELSMCAEGCFDLSRDPLNCGECENSCAGGEVCADGLCVGGDPWAGDAIPDPSGATKTWPDADGDSGSDGDSGPAGCPEELELCDDECVYLGSDNLNCGECDNVCADGWVCVDGACASSCPHGYIPCGDSCVDIMSDPMHCGHCDAACDSGICDGGACAG